MFPTIQKFLASCEAALPTVSGERARQLEPLARWLRERQGHGPIALHFICTHNSRRSHLGQIWGKVVADYVGVTDVVSFSGGTEATAVYPSVVQALRSVGFRVEAGAGDNPRYELRYSDDAPPLVCFSKTFDHPENPTADFCAVMTCTDADQNCPVIPGAAPRLSIPYEDPKIADGTAEESARYEERSRQIATELLWAFREAQKMGGAG